MEVKNIAVLGTGAMGSGIAYVASWSGFNVTVTDMNEELVEKGVNMIKQAVMTGIDKGKMTAKEGEGIVTRIKGSADLAETVKGADLVIEAVFEDMEVKKEIFGKLNDFAPEQAVLASNTSTLSITEISSVISKDPGRVIGMHFFNPVPAMKLVEIVMGENTSEEAKSVIQEVSQKLGKKTVIAKDTPGFIVNRILVPVLNEAVKLIEAGVTMEDIDKAMMLGANFPMGPIALADFVGLDVAYHSQESLYRGLGECYKPSDLLKEKVEKGELGMKTGKGFYSYK